MFCIKCGSYLPDGSQFCGVCGAAQTAPQEPVAPVAETPVQYAPAQPAWSDPYAQAPVEPQAQAWADPYAQPQAQAWADPYAQPQAQAWADPYAQPQAQPQAQAWADPYAQPQAQPQAQAWADPYAQPQAQPQAQAWADPYAQPQAQPQAQAWADPYAQPQAQAWADPFAYPQAQPQPAAPAKKKGGKGLVITLISLFTAVAVLASAVLLPVLGVALHNTKYGEWISHSDVGMSIAKVVAPSERYKELVYDTNVADSVADLVSQSYGAAITGYKDILTGGNKSGGVKVSLEVGQSVQNMLASSIPAVESVDVNQLLSLLDGASVSLSGGNSGDLTQIALSLGLGGKDLIQVNAVLNMVQQQLLVAVPTLSDTYLDVSEVLDEIDMDAIDTEMLDQVTAIIDALPSEETVNKLLSKYLRLVLDQFDNVEKSTEEIKVGGVRQKVTALTTKITQKDLVKMVPTVLKALQKDADVKKVIVNVGNAIGAMNGAEDMGEELYEQFAEQDFSGMGGYDSEDTSYVQLTDYVSSNEVIGRKVMMCEDGEKTEILYYANVVKSGKFYFELESNVAGFAVTGEGTDNKGVISGAYTVMQDDEALFTIGVSDLDTNALKDGTALKGIVTVAPSADIMNSLIDAADLPSEITTAVSLLDCNLRVEFDCSQTSEHINISLCSQNEVLLGIALDSVAGGQSMSVPSDDKVMEMDEIQEWLNTVDLSKLINTLKELGVPANLTDMLESGWSALQSGGFGGSSAVSPLPEESYDDFYDDYYDDDYDDYDDYYDDYYDGDYGTGTVVDDNYGW